MTDKKPIRPDGIYTPVVPPYVPPRQKIERGTANTINRAEPREKLLNVAGYGEVVPVLYGEDRVGGVFIAGPVVKSNFYICAIAWSATNEHGIEGVQQVVINGSTATISGATITHYKGTQDTIDATLTAAFAGFNQKYKGIAYTVFKIPAAGVNGVPRLEAVVRGMKIKDPRTDVVSWTENPALHMFDFVTNDKYGAGMTVRGLAECADYCDSLYKTLPRCRAAIYINEAHDLSVQLDMFAAYAECLWSYEGSGVFIVPDAAVALGSITDISISSITIGTMRLGGVDASNVPTRVTVTHTTPSAVYSDPWPQNSVYYDAAGVTTGDLDVINSDVRLIGIHRELEARRKCLLRLKRLSVPARISFQIQGDGIAIQRGDVKRLPDMLGLGHDYLVRIMSNELVSYGEYQMTAEPYSEAMYDVDVENSDEFIPIPVGGILPYFGTDTPAGFEEWTDANGKLIQGGTANESIPASTAFTAVILTSTNGDHAARSESSAATGIRDDAGISVSHDNRAMAGGHNHTAIGSVTIGSNQPKHASLKFIKCTVASIRMPISSGVFARAALSTSMSESNKNIGLFISSGGAGVIGGTDTRSVAGDMSVLTSASGEHFHGDFRYFLPAVPSPSGSLRFSGFEGNHQHLINHTNLKPKFEEIKLALYVAGVLSNAPIGGIIGFQGAAIPVGWQLCTQLVDKYIALSSSSDAGKTASQSVSASGQTAIDGLHTHGTVSAKRGGTPVYADHYHQDGAHAHSFTFTPPADINPARYKLVFIEYIGE